MMNKQYILTKLRELKPVLKSEYSVKQIGLFGSFASDSALETSDIDLLIELEKPIGWKFFSLEIYLEQIFGRKIDLVTKNALRDSMKANVLDKVDFV
jgi:predicted nucleotidyltransferase